MADQPRREIIPAHILWPGLVVVVLAMSLITGAITIAAATSDPSHAIVPRYYEKALAWDQSAAAARASDALGWNATLTVATAATATGERALYATLTDADKAPIPDADLTVTCFHNARAADRHELALEPLGSGAYTATLDDPRHGAWRFQLTATRDADTFIADQQVWVHPPMQRPDTPR